MSKSKLYKPLSNYDLLDAVMKDMKDRGNIIDTTKLTGAETPEQIFKGRGHAILFEMPPGAEDVGHWTCLLRQKATNMSPEKCIYFDSYGDKLSIPKLRNILRKKYNNIEYNPECFQSTKTSVCGRYALLGVGLNKIIPNLEAKNIIDFLKTKPKNQTFDQFVLDITKDI